MQPTGRIAGPQRLEQDDAIGLEFVGPQYPNGRRAFTDREWLAPDSKNVPTFYTTHEKKPEAASQQLDYAFACAASTGKSQ